MSTLHFEHEHKAKKTNLVIVIVALLTLVCVGFGCSYMMKQTGSDNTKMIMQDAEHTTSQAS